MGELISARASRLFAASIAFAREDADRIRAEHAAKGRLQSGATIKRIVTAFANRSCAALDECLASVSARVDHRGRQWNKGIAEVHRAIERHMDSAAPFVKKELGVISPDSERLWLPLLAEIDGDLHQRAEDYREGWTSPRAKPWRERNALLYALALALAGAMVSEGAKQAWAALFSPSPLQSSSERATRHIPSKPG